MWFLGTLVPVIGIMQVGEQAMAERYTYLPLIGLFIAIVWLIGDSVANSPKIRIVTQLLAVAVIVACAVKTDAQVKVWQDNVTLFSHVLAIDPRTEYAILGRTAEAQEYFERALVYKHSDPVVLSYAAFTMIEVAAQTHDLRNLPLAEQRLDEALRIDPDNPEVLTVAADAHLYLANALLAQDKLGEAAQEYRQVLAIAPGNYNAHTKLGIILVKQGLTEEALRELRISLAFKPDQAIAHSEIGSILSEKHQYPEAVEEFTQTLRFDPSNAYAHNDLGVALFLSGDYEKAAEQFGNALQIDPNYSDARRNLGYAQSKIKNK
jgi:tetratricopeptide (TPR) repeat protein